MQNIVINMCEKFHYDRQRNDRALGNGKSDNNNNNNNNNVGSAWGPVSGSNKNTRNNHLYSHSMVEFIYLFINQFIYLFMVQ